MPEYDTTVSDSMLRGINRLAIKLATTNARVAATLNAFDTVRVDTNTNTAVLTRLIRRPDGQVYHGDRPRYHQVRVANNGTEVTLIESTTINGTPLTSSQRRAPTLPDSATVMAQIEKIAPTLALELGVNQVDIVRSDEICQVWLRHRDGTDSRHELWLDRHAEALVVDGIKTPWRAHRDFPRLAAGQQTALTLGRALGGELGELIQAASLLDGAGVAERDRHRLTRWLRNTIDARSEREDAPTSAERRAAAFTKIPYSAEVFRRHGRKRRLGIPRSSHNRSLFAQCALAAGQATLAYLPAGLLAADKAQRARYFAALAVDVTARGIVDRDTIAMYARRAAEKLTPRRFLERVGLGRFVLLHGLVAVGQCAARIGATIAVGSRNAAILLENTTRRMTTGLASGFAEGVTARHQVAASDISGLAKQVARRAEAVDQFARLEQTALRLHYAINAIPDAHRDPILIKTRTDHEPLVAEVADLLAEFGYQPAALITNAAPSDSIPGRTRAAIRVGPQALASLFSWAISAAVGRPALGFLSASPLVEKSLNAAFSGDTRIAVARDDAKVAAANCDRRHTRANVARAAMADHDRRASRADHDRPQASQADAENVEPVPLPKLTALAPNTARSRGPRPWPYLWRAIRIAPFTLAATVPTFLIDSLRSLALGVAVSAVLGPIATGLYWEADRWLAHEEKLDAEPTADAIAIAHGPTTAAEAAAKLSTVNAELTALKRRLLNVREQRERFGEVFGADSLVGQALHKMHAQRQLPLAERCYDHLATLTPAEAQTWVREIAGPGRRRTQPHRFARNLRRSYEADITAIARVEHAHLRADEHLPAEQNSARTLPPAEQRTVHEAEYLELCHRIADSAVITDPSGRLFAAALRAGHQTPGRTGSLLHRFAQGMNAVLDVVAADINRVQTGIPATALIEPGHTTVPTEKPQSTRASVTAISRQLNLPEVATTYVGNIHRRAQRSLVH